MTSDIPRSRAPSGAARTSAEIVQAASERTTVYYDQCRAASCRLSDDLMSYGHRAQVLRCAGLRVPAPLADTRWHKVGAQEFWIHYVVIIDAQVVDLTRRQFFPRSETPFYQSVAAFAAEWDSFAPEVQNPRMRSSTGL